MPLLPPRVKGPLSECSDSVRVEAALTGALVEVLVAGGVVGSATSTGPEITVSLTAGLNPGDAVRARQTIGTDTSAASPDSVVVQAKPPQIGHVAYRSHLHVCGECLWLEGLVPGAKVEVTAPSGLHGSASSYDGNARVHLSAPIQAGDLLEAVQEACGEHGPPTQGHAPDWPGGDQGAPLGKPTVESPLRKCQRGVVVGDVYEGATVELIRSGGPNLTACFDATSLRFTVNPPLAEGEVVTANQGFVTCEMKSSDADPVVVGPHIPVPPPVVVGPLCAGATEVRLSGLLYGSLIRIYQDGSEIGTAESPTEGTYDFPVPPLAAPGHHGGQVTARQELCGDWSAHSDPVDVDPAPEDIPTPEIPEPLFECATAVLVKNVRPGARVYVVSATLGAPIGEAHAITDEILVTVAPMLAVGDEIHAYQRGCGLKSAESAPVEVQPLEELPPPQVERPLYACDLPVVVTGAVPGARVEVYVNGAYRGSAVAGEDRVEVPIVGSLEVGDLVTARQRLCEKVSDFGEGVRVEAFDGRWYTVGDKNTAQILAVHAALLPTGKIVYFGGDQHTGSLNADGDVDHTRLFDTRTHQIHTITGLPASADLFCAGHSQLENGSLLVGGGTHGWGPTGDDPHGHGPANHFIGSREAWVFEANGHAVADHTWRRVGELVTQRNTDPDLDTTDLTKTGGKWYPTLVTLPDGRAIAVSGHPRELDSRHNNDTLEAFDPGTETWSYIGATDVDVIPRAYGRSIEYPRMFVIPPNDVICVSQFDRPDVVRWKIGSDANPWTVVAPISDVAYHGNPLSHTAVLLPLRPQDEYTVKILLCGKKAAHVLTPDGSTKWHATTRVLAGHPTAGDMNPERNNLDTVILPTGEVFVAGGAKAYNDDATGVKKAEMFDPENPSGKPMGTWRVLPEAQEVRNYHSVALLMPNGAVWVAGSNFNSATGLNNRNLWIEIFEPWYFCHRRPRITSIDTSVCTGQSFSLTTDDAAKVHRVVMVRAGSATHNFNPDQRLVECEFEVMNSTRLSVEAPPNNAIAPPGTYLVFVLTAGRVPSEGKFIKVCRGTKPSPVSPWPEWFDDWILEMLRWRLRPKPTPWPPPWIFDRWPWPMQEPPEPPKPVKKRDDLGDWLAALWERASEATNPLREIGARLEDVFRDQRDDTEPKDDHARGHHDEHDH